MSVDRVPKPRSIDSFWLKSTPFFDSATADDNAIDSYSTPSARCRCLISRQAFSQLIHRSNNGSSFRPSVLFRSCVRRRRRRATAPAGSHESDREEITAVNGKTNKLDSLPGEWLLSSLSDAWHQLLLPWLNVSAKNRPVVVVETLTRSERHSFGRVPAARRIASRPLQRNARTGDN